MSNALNGTLPASFESGIATFTVTNGTAAKVIIETKAAAAAGATSPLYWGGSTVIDGTISSTDSAAKDVQFYRCNAISTIPSGTTTTSTIPRASGSYITDGWQIGDLVMTFAPFGTAPNAGVDGILCVVTGVAALTLTVNGTPLAALALAANTRVCRVAPIFKTAVPANSGTNNTAPNVNILGNPMDTSKVSTESKLGATDIYAAAMGSAVSALPAYVSVQAQIARY